MKKISLIVGFLFCAFVSFGQNGNWQQTNLPGNTNSISQTPGPVRGNGGVIAPSFVDTSAANAAFGGNKVNSVAGTQIWNTTTKSYWFWNGYRWIEVSPSTAPCQTSLVGSATWSGAGLQYNVTPLDYYILCNFYHTAATTVTLSTADPSYDRYDIIVCDIFQTVGVVTGTPGAGVPNPINPFTQRIVATVRVPGGSTTPGGTSSTIVYNENVEWSVTSNVSGLNANSTTNTCVGTKNISVPSAANGQYIQMQNGVQLSINNYQYLNFDLRLDGALTGSPISFLTVTFYDGTTQTSLPFLVSNGSYGFNASSLNTCQKISIPIVPPFNISTFDRVKFTISGAPSVFHIDYVYLLSGASTPPVISSGWSLNLNTGTNPTTNGIGTSDSVGVAIKTNSQTRLIFPANGIVELSNDELDQQLLTIRNDTIYKTNIPTAYGTLPIVVEIRNDSTFITCPTCDTTGGGGGSGWGLTGNAGTAVGTNFIGTTDDVGLMFKINNIKSGSIDQVLQNTSFGYETLQSPTNAGGGSNGTNNVAIGYRPLKNITTGNFNIGIGTQALLNNTTGFSNIGIGGSSMLGNTTGQYNTAIGLYSLAGNTTGISNTAIGLYSLTGNGSSLLSCITGQYNTAIGYFAGTTATNTDTSIAIGADARASTKQFTISDYINKWKSYGLSKNGTTINQVLTDTTGNGDLALKPISLSGYVQFSDTSSTIGTKYEQVFIKGSGAGSITTKTGGNIASGENSVVIGGSGNNNAGNTVFMMAEGGVSLSNTEAGAMFGYNPYAENTTDFFMFGTTPVALNASGSLTGGINANSYDGEGIVSIGYAPTGTGNGAVAISGIANNPHSAAISRGVTNADSSFAIMGGTANYPNSMAIGAGIVSTVRNTVFIDSLRVKNSINHGEWKASPIANAYIANPNVTVNGQLINLGGSGTVAAAAGTLTGSTLASGVTSSSLTSFGSSIALGTPASGNFSSGTFTWPTFNQNTTGSAASLTTGRKINGVSFNGTADITVDKRLLAYQALGSTIVAENVDGQLAQVINSLAMTSQRAYFQAVYIDKDQTITGFKWKQATAGSYTANNYNGGALYSYSGGTLTLVASSTNDGNIWTATSGTIGSKAFSSPYSATAGLYFVAIIWSASATTTAPSLGTLTATSSINTVTDFTNSAKTSGLISSLTALPSPTQAISGITASANEFWIGLY